MVAIVLICINYIHTISLISSLEKSNASSTMPKKTKDARRSMHCQATMCWRRHRKNDTCKAVQMRVVWWPAGMNTMKRVTYVQLGGIWSAKKGQKWQKTDAKGLQVLPKKASRHCILIEGLSSLPGRRSKFRSWKCDVKRGRSTRWFCKEIRKLH